MRRRIGAIAWQDLLDLGRQRGTWVSLLMFPVINVLLIVVVPGFLSEREQAKQDTERYRVAIEAVPDDSGLLRDELIEANFDVIAVPDARRAVRTRVAHVGLRLDAGAREAFEGTDQAQARVIALTTRRASNLAFGRLIEVLETVRIDQAATRALAAGLPKGAVRPITVEQVDLADSAAGARLELSHTLPFLALLPLTAAVGISAQRISGAKDLRIIEPLLLLPVRRFEVLAGKALAGFALGAVILPAVVVPLVASRFLPAGGAGRTVALGVETIAAITGVAALLLVVLVSIGAFAGAVARTSTELSSALPFVTLPLVLLAMALQFFTGVRATATTAFVPVLGPALLLRDAGAGVAASSAAALTVVATAVWAVVLLALATRFLERERTVLRATG